MKNLYYGFLFFVIGLTPSLTNAQCSQALELGQNLVVNGDFSQGYTGWTYTSDPARVNGYDKFTSGWSSPGYIYAGASADFFNHDGFDDYPDHTPNNNDNMMLMVDGICTNGIKLWQQTVSGVVPNTRYYFSVWISSIKDNPNYPGELSFDINGTDYLGTIITAPAAGHTWQLVEIFWDSGPTPAPTVALSIENRNLVGCDTEVDFAIDDIAFTPGCSFATTPPQPDLGIDQTICGKGGSILLNSNVPSSATTTVTWSDGATGTGLSAPYTHSITTAGTYGVCVKKGSSCWLYDEVVITNTYSIDLGPDLSLCNPAFTTLNAQFTGPGVTYQWYKNYPTTAPVPNSGQTYTVTTPGTYRVDVTDPVCGLRSDVINVTSIAPTPMDAYYYNAGETPTLSIVGAGTFNWYDTPTKGTGTSNTQINLGDGLASGVYVVTVQLADDVKTIKITKK